MPPTVATSATLGTDFNSYLRNQSCSARSCARSLLAAAVDERVLVDPAHAGRVGAERRLRARRQASLHLVQVFEHARARPVEIGAVLEQHVDERIAEERIAAHGLRAGHRQHRRRQRIGHLILDDLRRLSRERRADDHLRVGQVGNRVERRRPHRPHARDGEKPRREQHEEAVRDRPADQRGDHFLSPAVGRRRSTSAACRPAA